MKKSNSSRRYPRAILQILMTATAALFAGCGSYGGGGSTNPVTVQVSPATATVQTGQTQQFTASVTYATNTGVTWEVNGVAGGNATVGTISTSGLYTAPSTVPNPAGITVTATSVADTTKSGSATVTIVAAAIAVTVTPVRGGLAITQTLSVKATVTGDSANAGVTWAFTSTGSPAGGQFSSNTSASGTAVTFTAPSGAGVATITATSVTDVTKSASATIGVTDLAGVLTYHNDNSRDGINAQEYALTTSNVKPATFGKLFSCQVDGAVYAQPLWVANVTISGVKHNVVIVATEHDGLYAFDADASPCLTLWQKSLIDNTHGGTSGEVAVPGTNVGAGTGDLRPEVGITGTPVIDSTSNTIYVVSKSENTGSHTFFQRLHAIDLLTGAEKFSGPASIDATITVPGTGDGSSGGIVPFHVQNEHQRAGLALAGGVVYVAWASHEDQNPYHGWVMGFSASPNLILQSKHNDSPNGNRGGIWMAGGAPAIDSSGNLFVITGNGDFDGTNDFGDSILKLSSTLVRQDFFTPSVEAMLESQDLDLGSGGAVVLVDNASLPTGFQHLLIGGGKGSGFNGQIYSIDRTNLGQFNASDIGAKQIFAVGGAIFATPAFWQNTLYIAGSGTKLFAYSLNTSGANAGKFNTLASSQSSSSYGFPGSTPSVSANGNSNGIVWALNNSTYCTAQSPSCGPAVLHAYDATNLNTELWHSDANAADAAGFAVKFTVPTIANGKVYVGTRGNDSGNGTSSTLGELDVYGLKPN